MKISKAKTNRKKTPFVSAKDFTMTTQEVNNKIVSFTVTVDGTTKIFPIGARFNILSAWKRAESYFSKLKTL